MLDTRVPKLDYFPPNINAEKSYNVVFIYTNRRFSVGLTLQGHPLKPVGECVYSSVVSMDNLAYTSNVEQSKPIYFKQRHYT